MMWTTRPRSEQRSIATLVAGTGPRVLLIHGVGLRAEAWAAQIDTLVHAGCQALAVDLPGHGSSDAGAGAAGIADFAQLLTTLLDRPTLLVGHSMGAMIALELAAMHPELTRGVVAMNGIYRRSEAARLAVQQRAAALDGTSPVVPATTLQRWFGDQASPERQACEDWLRAMNPEAYRHAYRAFAGADGPADAQLQALTCPALFMTGGREPNSTPAMSQAMAQAVPQGRAQVVETAAHMMPMTHPAAVNAALLGFAKECHHVQA